MPQVRVGDADLYYEEFGTGDPLLIVHGILETGRSYARVGLALSSGYRVVIPDLRGYGRSGPRPRHFPPDFYARDAADLAGLLTQLDLTGVRVLGFGDGAEVALLLALAVPERVRAMIAVDVSGAFAPSLLEVLPTFGDWATAGSSDTPTLRNEAFQEYGRAATLAMWAEWKAAVRAMIAAGGDISLSQAERIACPVLLINGADDPVNTVAVSERLAAALPQAELRLIPDMGQLVYSRQNRLFSDLTATWFAAH